MQKSLQKIFSVVCVWTFVFLAAPVCAAKAQMRAGVVSVASGTLNVRSTASKDAPILTALPRGSYITLWQKSGDWWRVEYQSGKYGYCHTDYISLPASTPATVQTNGGNLYIRSGAGTSCAIVDKLPSATPLLILSEADGWCRVLYRGNLLGYAAARYLAVSEQGDISLSVPYYAQTDSRWASVQVGASGKTLAQIGCATTAVSMLESYRTGKTIYPDEMSRRLRYTASGSVYWPADYTAVTKTDGYLDAIHTLLSAGKPVLFGAKNASGGQHWVVICGCTADAMDAADFTICDPGKAARTNLQQFLSAYPVFYKYFRY